MVFLKKRVWPLSLVFICLFVGTFLFIGTPCKVEAASPKDPLVRVAVLKEADNFVLAVRGPYTIWNPRTNQLISKGRRMRKSRVLSHGGGLYIGKDFFSTRHLRIKIRKEARIYVARKVHRYRGQLDIYADDKGLLVVNALPIEGYIKGVLYHEVPHKWPIEVIKAQAVAARTYVLYRMTEQRERRFDVTSDIYSQVYGGRGAERYRTNLAADRTRGEVLLYNGKILPAYFHAACGGHTEDARELWNLHIPPLKGVPCEYCRRSPHFSWKKNFQSSAVQKKLVAAGHSIGLIKDIRIVQRTRSGRVKTLRITDRAGKTLRISGKDFRQIVGPNRLKSSLYDIVMRGYYFDVMGRGWGHGVGLCQWGAYYMAVDRFRYKEILRYYYPGAELKKADYAS